jgi:hypothetical protein
MTILDQRRPEKNSMTKLFNTTGSTNVIELIMNNNYQPYDLENVVYSNDIRVLDTEITPSEIMDMDISIDGKHMYFLSLDGMIRHHELIVPWDLRTSVIVDTYDSSTLAPDAISISITPTGNSLYVLNSADNKLHQLGLDTTWNLALLTPLDWTILADNPIKIQFEQAASNTLFILTSSMVKGLTFNSGSVDDLSAGLFITSNSLDFSLDFDLWNISDFCLIDSKVYLQSNLESKVYLFETTDFTFSTAQLSPNTFSYVSEVIDSPTFFVAKGGDSLGIASVDTETVNNVYLYNFQSIEGSLDIYIGENTSVADDITLDKRIFNYTIAADKFQMSNKIILEANKSVWIKTSTGNFTITSQALVKA